MKDIRSSKHLLVFVDKSTNLYKMSGNEYKKLLNENITKTYRKLDKESKSFAKSLSLEKKMECFADRHTFITLKDHKDNFRTNTKCRLINPSKNEMGIVSKKYLEKIIEDVTNASKVNQLRNTSTVIDWFQTIPNKNKSRFIKFDIVELYPSISEQLLDKSINHARTLTTIDDNVIAIIKHARKSLLFDKNNVCIKKGENTIFDITMGSFDGAEVCELVGLYLLEKLSALLIK